MERRVMAALTSLELIGAADESLQSAGYRRVDPTRDDSSHAQDSASRTYEDEFGVVGLFVFETPESLGEGWPDAQSELVDTMTRHIARDEDKAWDGYLVLLTPIGCDQEQRHRLNQIRYDTTRVRKIVASGDDLHSLSDVTRVLLPLLPLGPAAPVDLPSSALELLPALLERHEIDARLTAKVVEAYEAQRPMITAIFDELVDTT